MRNRHLLASTVCLLVGCASGNSEPGDNTSLHPASVGAVTPRGGAVPLLHFGLTGDTRPPSCEDTAHYPTTIINNIADQLTQKGAQFALDLGDHMYVCNDDLTVATAQMNLFVQSTARYLGTWFMTMGNHECWKGPCLAGNQTANYVAFMKALTPISATPYYTFDVQTSLGIATFVVVADNAWDATQSAWLEQTLARADQSATYTIVAKHHPAGDSSVPTNAEVMQIIRSHKFALLLTGHSHLYKHSTTDNGRDLILGTGGAPLIAGGAFYGYALVDQDPSGQLTLSVFDIASSTQVDQWSVPPSGPIAKHPIADDLGAPPTPGPTPDLGVAGADLSSPPPPPPTPPTGTCAPTVNEVQTAGLGGAQDEFVELYNGCPGALDLTGYRLVYRSAAGSTDIGMVTFSGVSIPSGGHLVCGQTNFSGKADVRYTTSMAETGGAVALHDGAGAVVDSVGWGSATNAYVEAQPAPAPPTAKSIARHPDGHGSHDNQADFTVGAATPGAAN